MPSRRPLQRRSGRARRHDPPPPARRWRSAPLARPLPPARAPVHAQPVAGGFLLAPGGDRRDGGRRLYPDERLHPHGRAGGRARPGALRIYRQSEPGNVARASGCRAGARDRGGGAGRGCLRGDGLSDLCGRHPTGSGQSATHLVLRDRLVAASLPRPLRAARRPLAGAAWRGGARAHQTGGADLPRRLLARAGRSRAVPGRRARRRPLRRLPRDPGGAGHVRDDRRGSPAGLPARQRRAGALLGGGRAPAGDRLGERGARPGAGAAGRRGGPHPCGGDPGSRRGAERRAAVLDRAVAGELHGAVAAAACPRLAGGLRPRPAAATTQRPASGGPGPAAGPRRHRARRGGERLDTGRARGRAGPGRGERACQPDRHRGVRAAGTGALAVPEPDRPGRPAGGGGRSPPAWPAPRWPGWHWASGPRARPRQPIRGSPRPRGVVATSRPRGTAWQCSSPAFRSCWSPGWTGSRRRWCWPGRWPPPCCS